MDEVKLGKIKLKIENRKRLLPDFANDFLKSLELDRAIQTQLEYAKDIHLFFDYLIDYQIISKSSTRAIALDDLARLSEDDIRTFMDYTTRYQREFRSIGGNKITQEFTNGPRGKERKRVTIHNLYEYLIERKILSMNPVSRIKIAVKKQSIKPRLTSHEMYQVFDTVLNNNPDEFRRFRNFVMVKVLAFTGIRISELTNMDIEDVWRSRNEMVVTRKGGEKDAILVNNNIRDDLYRYLDIRKSINNIQKGHEKALFISQRMRRMDPRSVRKMIDKICVEAGVDIKVTPHTFRRTFGWKHYNDYHDLELTAEVLGHSSPETTRQNYANADRERIASSLNDFRY